METGEKKQKRHRPSRSAIKLRKKQKKNGKFSKRHNPKAFTFSGGVISVQRNVQRTMDIRAKREKVEQIDKTPAIPPPYIVVVQGPPKCGKTTLIRSLVKHYTKHTLTEVNGPITVVTGKNRRLTFIECPNAIPAMLDLSKIADLALLMIDAKFGFEMETFEFLSILKIHGFPRILGVLTHLDKFDDTKIVKKTKKSFKKRFWTEIYEGAKLFYLSGLHYRRYRKREILNLARFLAVQKFGVLTWRSAHPYLLALRVEKDAAVFSETSPPTGVPPPSSYPATTSPSTSVDAYFYGYLKGARLRKNQPIHIPGAGDFQVDTLVEYPDPCAPPLPRNLDKKDASYLSRTTEGNRLQRSLKDNQRAIYAPFCDVGNVQFDADAVYIHLPNAMVNFTKPEAMLSITKPPPPPPPSSSKVENEAMADSEASSEEGSEAASESEKSLDADDASESGSDATSTHETVEEGRREEGKREEGRREEGKREKGKREEGRTSSTGGALPRQDPFHTDAIVLVRRLQEAELQMEKTLAQQTLQLLPTSTVPLEPPPEEDHASSAFPSEAVAPAATAPVRGVGGTSLKAYIYYTPPSPPRPSLPSTQTAWELFPEEAEDEAADAATTLEAALPFSSASTAAERDGVDTACVSIQMLVAANLSPYGHPTQLKEALQDAAFITEMKEAFFITGGWDSADEEDNEKEEDNKDEMEAKTATAENDTPKAPMPLSFFDQTAVEALSNAEMGVAIGRYIRIGVKNLPHDWFLQWHLNQKPVVVGGLLPGETGFGFQHLRIQKHRWAPKILKTNDPLIFSVGWRRFQTLPVFFIDERNEKRQRMLKYTPEHMHCKAAIYGPIIPPNTGILAVKSFQLIPHFRIAGIGVVLESAASLKIMKKLKLVGEPKKIYKHTAFIKGMFNSDLEVAKFIGAKIQTVSGIRGQIKKAAGTDGSFRSSFEDKILLSDIVMCKSWIRVDVHKFYNALLDIKDWRVMRSTAEIRNLHQLPIRHKPESEYGPKPERLPKRFNPLQIPVSLVKMLPFASKPKIKIAKKKKQDNLTKDTALKMSPYEKKVAFLFQKLQTLRNTRRTQREENAKKRMLNIQKQTQATEVSRLQKQKVIRKERYTKAGKREASMRRKLRLEE